MEKSDVDCIIQTVSIARELETLKEKIDDKQIVNNVHLQSFRKYCCHKDPQVAKLACDVVVKLVVQQKLSITEAVTWFISSLQSSESPNVISMTLRDVLLLNISQQNQNSIVEQFGLVSPQHPFILILKEDNTKWPLIEYHIQYMFNVGNLETVFSSLSSFFKYVLWSPPGQVDIGCRRSAWNLLVHNFTPDFSKFITKTVCWLRTDQENSVLNVNFFLPDLHNLQINVESHQKASFICVLTAEIICNAAKSGQDPTFGLVYLKEMLKKYPETTDLVLILIAESLPFCTISFIGDFLRACIEIINTNGVSNMIVVWAIIGAILPWIIHSMTITREITILSNSLFDIVDGKTTVSLRETSLELHDSWFMECVVSFTESYWALVIIRSIQTLSLEDLIERLSNFVVTSDVIRENFIVNLIITAAFLCSDNEQVQIKTLDTLVKRNAGFQLPLILFKLSRTSSSEMQLKLLHSLPLTAVVKENIPPIIATIRSLSSSGKPVLVQLTYSLYSTLWKTEERCYQFLSDKLKNCKKEWDGSLNDYHLDVVVASVIRDICALKPDIHGKEWVKELADIISRYPTDRDCLPLTIALQAVIKMCKTKTIDIFSVYEEFEKKQLLVDRRTEVIIQLCDMIGFMFQVATELMTDTQNSLSVIWGILHQSSEKEVTEAALSALSKYSFEGMPVSVLPDEYKKNLKVPQKYQKKKLPTADDDEYFSFMPGVFWIDYLRNAAEEVKPKVCELLTVWLAQEVKNFNRSIFHCIHRERESVLSFHDKSIFKATVNNCKYAAKKLEPRNADQAELKMVFYCLRILNGQPAKSLPPFNWTFLNDFLLVKNDELKKEVLKFWAKESVTSTSAKNCIETWLKKIDMDSCDVKDLEMTLEIVSTFCTSVASETIASFFSNTMQHVLVKCGIEEYESNLYSSTCLCLREALKQPEIDEHNCEAICKNLVSWWGNAAVQNEYFDYLIDAVKEMPSTYVDYTCSLSLSEHVSTEDLYKILRLRCSLALNDLNNPFLWLNDCIEATVRRLQDKILFFECTLEALKKHRFHSSKWTWLLQLLDRIQVSADIASDEVCDFKCDIFIFCVVNTSTYHPFLHDATSVDECYEYFPQALRNIMVDDVSSQVIEWLSHSCKMKKISDKHKQWFTKGIMASRRNKYLQKLSSWSSVAQKL